MYFYMFLCFLLLHFHVSGLSFWLLGIKSRPGHSQGVSSGAQLGTAHLWIRAYTLNGNRLAWSRARGVSQQIRLGVGTHG